MNKFDNWFKTQSSGWDAIDPEDAWNAAIDAVIRVYTESSDELSCETYAAIEALKS